MAPDLLKGSSVGSEPTLCPHPYRRQSCTVYLANEAGEVMGLCGMCKHVFDRLLETEADLDTVRRELLDLGYTEEDARRYHADMQEVIAA